MKGNQLTVMGKYLLMRRTRLAFSSESSNISKPTKHFFAHILHKLLSEESIIFIGSSF